MGVSRISVTISLNGPPVTSTAGCSSVLSPPRERSGACGLLFRAFRMLARSHDSRVDEYVFDFGLLSHDITTLIIALNAATGEVTVRRQATPSTPGVRLASQ
jgi:hypothetical protein